MKVTIILTVVAFATLTSAANDFQERIANLQSTLTSALEKSSNEKVNQLATHALKTLKTAAMAGETETSVKAVEKIQALIPSLDNMMNNGPATRANVISTLTSLIGDRKDLLGSVLNNAADAMKNGGNSPWAAILKTAADAVKNQVLGNENNRALAEKAAGALDLIEDAVALLNDFTGGVNPVLNMASNAISTLDNASDTILNREKDDDTKNVIVTKLVSMLYKMKNSNNQFAFDTIHKVCDKMHASQKKQAN